MDHSLEWKGSGAILCTIQSVSILPSGIPGIPDMHGRTCSSGGKGGPSSPGLSIKGLAFNWSQLSFGGFVGPASTYLPGKTASWTNKTKKTTKWPSGSRLQLKDKLLILCPGEREPRVGFYEVLFPNLEKRTRQTHQEKLGHHEQLAGNLVALPHFVPLESRLWLFVPVQPHNGLHHTTTQEVVFVLQRV